MLMPPPPALGPDNATSAESRRERALPTLVAEIQPDGRVHFGSVPKGRYATHADCANHVAKNSPALIEIDAEDVTGVSWVVAPGMGLSIDVIDERSRPVPNAQLVLLLPASAPGEGAVMMPYTADIHGHCDIPAALAAGTYKLGPNGGAKGEPIEVELKDGMGIVPVTLRFTGSGAVEVETTLSDGTPASSGLLVNAYPTGEAASFSNAIAGSQIALGRYRIGPLIAGEYRIEVNDGINPPFSFESNATHVHVDAGGLSRLRVTVARAAEIRGRVLGEDGQPVANAWVRADYEPNADGFKNHTASLVLQPNMILTDTAGRFAISRLANGARFQVVARTFEGEEAEALGVAAGANDLTLTLRPAAPRPNGKGAFAQLGQ